MPVLLALRQATSAARIAARRRVWFEHDMDVALDFAERITVLNFGKVEVEATRSEVVAHPRTREIYLGE